MRRRAWNTLIVAAVATAASIATIVAVALPAEAHPITGFSLTCDTVFATLTTDTPSIHPVTWNVKVGNGGFQKVPTTETPIGSPGQDVTTVSANIARLTEGLAGQTAHVQAFISWAAQPTGEQTFSKSLTCGTPPTTAAPPTVGNTGVQVSPAEISVAPTPNGALAPIPLVAAARFTG
jgi:hypothetical protein